MVACPQCGHSMGSSRSWSEGMSSEGGLLLIWPTHQLIRINARPTRGVPRHRRRPAYVPAVRALALGHHQNPRRGRWATRLPELPEDPPSPCVGAMPSVVEITPALAEVNTHATFAASVGVTGCAPPCWVRSPLPRIHALGWWQAMQRQEIESRSRAPVSVSGGPLMGGHLDAQACAVNANAAATKTHDRRGRNRDHCYGCAHRVGPLASILHHAVAGTVMPGQGPYALFTSLDCATDCLRRYGAAV